MLPTQAGLYAIALTFCLLVRVSDAWNADGGGGLSRGPCLLLFHRLLLPVSNINCIEYFTIFLLSNVLYLYLVFIVFCVFPLYILGLSATVWMSHLSPFTLVWLHLFILFVVNPTPGCAGRTKYCCEVGFLRFESVSILLFMGCFLTLISLVVAHFIQFAVHCIDRDQLYCQTSLNLNSFSCFYFVSSAVNDIIYLFLMNFYLLNG